MSITIIEHEDLIFCGGIFTVEPDLAILRYKKKEEKILMKMMAPQSKS